LNYLNIHFINHNGSLWPNYNSSMGSKIAPERNDHDSSCSILDPAFGPAILNYDPEAQAKSVRVGYPSLNVFEYDTQDTLAKHLFGQRTSNLIFNIFKRFNIFLGLISSCSALIGGLHVSGQITVELSVAIVVAVIFVSFSALKMLLYSKKLYYSLLGRFEIQLVWINIFGYVYFYSQVQTDKSKMLLQVASCVPFIWVAMIDASPGRQSVRYALGLYMFFLVSALIGSFPAYTKTHVQVVNSEINLFGKHKMISINGRLNTCIFNLIFLGFKQFLCAARNPNQFVSLGSAVNSTKTSMAAYAYISAYSPHQLKTLQKQLDIGDTSMIDPKLMVTYQASLKLSPDVTEKRRFVLHVKEPFISISGYTLGRMAFGDTVGNFFLGTGGKILSVYYFSVGIPCALYTWYEMGLEREMQTVTWFASLSVLSFAMFSIININPRMVKRIATNFEALFVMLNLAGVLTCASFLFRNSSKVIIPIAFFPAVIIGTFADAQPSRKLYLRVYNLLVISGLSYFLLGLFLEFFDVEDVVIDMKLFQVSLLNRCYSFLVNLILIFTRLFYQQVRYPSQFLFIRAPMESVKLSTPVLRIAKQFTPASIISSDHVHSNHKTNKSLK